MKLAILAAVALSMALAGVPLHARDKVSTPIPVPTHGVIGVEEAHLQPEFWIARLSDPEQVVLDQDEITAQNAKLLQLDDSLHDLRALPATLTRAQVARWISDLSQRPHDTMFDADGKPVPATTIDALVNAMHLAAIPQQQPTRYGLVVHRADLRTFPTALRVFSTPGEIDIDRFQESALFPGTPVAIAHQSRDRNWWFVVSPGYAAWIDKQHVAEGPATQVFGYGNKTPYRVITGATEHTAFTPEPAVVSRLQLEMGVRVPVLSDWSPNEPVNGQHPYTSYVIELPLRTAAGALRFTPALLPKTADSAAGYLSLTRANLIWQGFKFLGERYGWGHAYNGRDCSGFVSEIYRSMGVQLPRNTSDQATSPALNRLAFTAADTGESRIAAVRTLQVGDLVYIPGHVMMVIGRIGEEPYVIHDTSGLSYRQDDGSIAQIKLNGVSVSPLTPLLFNQEQTYIERMTSIVRIRP